jgi:hypothetical protein
VCERERERERERDSLKSYGSLLGFFFSFFLFFAVLGIEPKALYTLGKHSTTELYTHPWVFETGSYCVAEDDLEFIVLLRLPPEYGITDIILAQFTHLNCVIQWCLEYSQSCTTITAIILEHFYHQKRNVAVTL